MKWLEKTALVRAMYRLREKPSLLLFIFAFCLLLITYLISKHQDTKVITYQNQSSGFTNSRVISSNANIYRKKDKVYRTKVEQLETKLSEVTAKLEEYAAKLTQLGTKKVEDAPREDQQKNDNPRPYAATPPLTAPVMGPTPPVRDLPTTTIVSNSPTRSARSSVKRKAPSKPRKGPQIITFPVKAKAKPTQLGVTIPSGAFVKAKLLTGVEAPEGKALPVLMQADYAFIGPNRSRVDLSGCFMIAKSTGNLSIERVEMQVTKVSCVSKSGKMFERPMNGYIADGSDNSFAVIGQVNSKRDRVATMSFLSSVVEGIGQAVAQTQTTTKASDVSGTTTSVTGSQARYIGATGAANAASAVTSWYLKHAEQLLPTINIGSGAEVWVILQESISLPNWYFKAHRDQSGGLSFLSNLLK